MNYAIIRNTKYTKKQLNLVYRHNERKNTNYANKDIDRNKSKVNYSIKICNMPYEKRLKEIMKEKDLKGKIKNISNVACEYIITASPDFFEELSEEEIKRYFETAYKFVCGFKNLGEEYILSAKVHLDESTPHMHLIYLPVVHTKDKKSGKDIEKLCCTDFWKGKNSYKVLQDNFYKYVTRAGFELERGDTEDNKHIKIEDLKKVTNYEVQKYEKEIINLEQEVETEDIELLKKEYKRVIKKFNTLAKQYTKVKVISENNVKNYEEVKQENEKLERDNKKLENKINSLKKYINKTFECVSILFDFPIERLKRIVNNFVRGNKENDKQRNSNTRDKR